MGKLHRDVYEFTSAPKQEAEQAEARRVPQAASAKQDGSMGLREVVQQQMRGAATSQYTQEDLANNRAAQNRTQETWVKTGAVEMDADGPEMG